MTSTLCGDAEMSSSHANHCLTGHFLFLADSSTCASSQPDSSQEDIAGQSLFVPHGELQADIVEVSGLQAAVGEGVVPLWVHSATLCCCLVLG